MRPPTLVAATLPFVVFGFLYMLAVRPQQEAAAELERRVDDMRAALGRRQPGIRPRPGVAATSAVDQFDARTPVGDHAAELVDALVALAASPAVGGVKNLSTAIGEPLDGVADPRLALFPRRVTSTPVTVSFEARYEQIGRLLWNLRVLPTTFELASLQLTPGAGLMRATVALRAFQRTPPASEAPRVARAGEVDVTTAPEWTRDPFAPAPQSAPAVAKTLPPTVPVVRTILVSRGRRVALVDGRIVRPGDRVNGAVVRAIEREFVEIATPGGTAQRLRLDPPAIRMTRQ